jgi:hypothetical protein
MPSPWWKRDKGLRWKLTAHSSRPWWDSFEALRPLREYVFSGESVRGRFSRSPGPAAIDRPERLRTFDLVASHHQIKNDSLSAISAALR